MRHQGCTNISLMEGKGFFTNTEIRDVHRPRKCLASKDDVEINDQPSMFVCPEEGCNGTFDSFSELELHTDVGIHDTRKSGSLYDKVWKNRAEKFSSIENQKLTSNKFSTGLTVNSTNSRLSIGWALNKGRTGGVRFSENVRRYLTTRFETGERKGKKASSEEIERQMRNARNERNERLFQREEWLTKTQIMFFFFHASLHGRELAVRMIYQRNRHLILQQKRMTTSTPSLETLIATICLTIFKAELDYSI